MIIKNVKIQNFKPYHGVTEIDLQPEENKPLILVRGKNDRGKSSLFSALKFAIYGFEGSNTEVKTKQRSAINRRAAEEESGETKVEVQFLHDGDLFEIERVIEFDQVEDADERSPKNSHVKVKQNGEIRIKPDDTPLKYNEFISGILPENAAKFFFFDAEEDLKNYMENTEDVKEAIETVLGIQELQNAIGDLDRRQNKYNKVFLNSQSSAKERTEAKRKLETIEDEISQLETEKEELESKLEKQEGRKQKLNQELGKIQEITDKVKERNKVEDRIAEVSNGIERDTQELEQLHRDTGPILASIGATHLDSCYEVDNLSDDPEIVGLLREVIKEGECVCGTDLSEKEITTIESRIQKLEGNTSQLLFEAKKSARNLRLSPGSEARRSAMLQKSIDEAEERLADLENQKEELDEEVKAAAEKDHEDLQRKVEATDDRIDELEQQIEDTGEEIIEKKVKKNQAEQRVDSLGGATEREQRNKDLRDFTGRCKNAFEKIKEDFVDTRRKDVEKHTSETFLQLTNKPDVYTGISITDDYQLEIQTKSGERSVEEQDPSAGATQIIAYSFVAGLNNYTARNAPVVIDTPLSRLDTIHKDHLLEYYPKFSKQVIILYQPSELNGSDLDRMKSNVSKHISIIEQDDDAESSTLKELDINLFA